LAENSVSFKANANGLVVVFDKNESFDGIYEQISQKLESGGFFFQTRYLATTYKGRKLSAEEEGKISKMMAEKTGARTVLFEIDKDFEREAKLTSRDAQMGAGAVSAAPASRVEHHPEISASYASHEQRSAAGAANTAAATVMRRISAVDLDECVTKYYRGTIRSGRLVSYDGNVVVIGDVNPGAEVEATGNVIVLGNVRGIIHAGASGNKSASIIALNFAPTQLRIADIITRRLERRGAQSASLIPEIAYIKGDAIVFESLIAAR